MIYYDIKITGKDVKRFIRNLVKMNINLYNIKYINKSVIIKVNKSDYLKIKDIKTVYDIRIIRYYGLAKCNKFLATYKLFFIILTIGFIFFLFLTNIIFEVEINTNNQELKKDVLWELEELGIKKYKFVKSYNQVAKIKEKLLAKNKSRIEWLEIKRIGTKYLIELEERKENNLESDKTPRNIVAKKSGIITKINSTNGEIVGKIDHYVKKGDVLISGAIHKKDEIKDLVRAEGKVYAETWYTVTVSLPYHYQEETNTGRKEYAIGINFLSKHKKLFATKHFISYNQENLFVFKNSLLPLSISIEKLSETNVKDNVFTIESAYFKASEIAKRKLLDSLSEDSEIIFEKKLKTNEINSKIEVVIFYKVIEDITAYSDIEINLENSEENR